jgi:hypothetical protein
VTPTYGLVSETADLDGPDWAWNDLVGTVRIRSRSDRPVFVGIGPEAEVQRYLAGVSHEIVGDLRDDPGDYDRRPGVRPPPLPVSRRSGPPRRPEAARPRSTGTSETGAGRSWP